MEHRLWVVCYDVHDETRLRKVARIMEQYGTRIQKSVFECWLPEEHLQKMQQAVRSELDAQTDTFRLYAVCKNCQAISESAGHTPIQTVQQYYIV